ncbi:MAG: hypothetical protein ACPG4N_01225 [Gammaproteobacteria bacterium]
MLAYSTSALSQARVSDSNSRIEICVEAICEKGCRAVGRIIQQLEAGETFMEVEDLNAMERYIVLRELQDVMAVYGGCCEVD